MKAYLGLEVIRITQAISKLAQPQNLEKERKLNSFFDISLDLEGLFGGLLYFLAG